MGEIVNLRRARKAVKRAEAADVAAANRVQHGRTRAERAAGEAERRMQARVLDGAQLDGAAQREAGPDQDGTA